MFLINGPLSLIIVKKSDLKNDRIIKMLLQNGMKAPSSVIGNIYCGVSNVLFGINSTKYEVLSQFSENEYSSSQNFIT